MSSCVAARGRRGARDGKVCRHADRGAALDLSIDVDGALVLAGEIDSYTAPDLAERLADDPPVEVARPGRRDVHRLVRACGSSSRPTRPASTAGARLVLRSPSAAVQRLLEISGLAGHLDVAS